MLEEMSIGDLLEWRAFDQVEPIGGQRGDWQAAAVCAQIANIAAIQRGGTFRSKPVDWLMEYGDEKPPMKVEEKKPQQKSWQELKFIARMWVADSEAKQKKRR